MASEQNAHLVYGGAPLASRQRAFWKVQNFDAEGEPSPWSAVASFEIGLLQPSDWAARWIASPIAGAFSIREPRPFKDLPPWENS